VPLAQKLLGFQIVFSEQRGIKELRNANAKPLAHFMDNTELYGIVSAINQVSNRGLRDTAFDIQLIIGHIPLFQQLDNSFTDGLIQQHP
jgi:hypothetical protein